MPPILASSLYLKAAGSTFAKAPPDASKMAFRGGVPQTDDTGAMILLVGCWEWWDGPMIYTALHVEVSQSSRDFLNSKCFLKTSGSFPSWQLGTFQ